MRARLNLKNIFQIDRPASAAAVPAPSDWRLHRQTGRCPRLRVEPAWTQPHQSSCDAASPALARGNLPVFRFVVTFAVFINEITFLREMLSLEMHL